jgi:hypothetical protein
MRFFNRWTSPKCEPVDGSSKRLQADVDPAVL